MNETKQDANPKPEPGSPNLVTRRHFVQTAAATALMLPLVGRVGGAQVAGERERLAHLADYFQHFAENYLLDGDGLVRAWLSPATLLPISPDELSPRYEAYLRDMCQNSPDKAGALTYENALMATGEFAMSQIERYQRTGSKDAFALARKAMGGILAVSREGRNYMPGYLPKPWGGVARARYSHEISTDQYTKAIAALDQWLPHASPEERSEILRFYLDAADFFIARNFRFPWRQKVIVEPHIHLHTLALYIPLMVLAARYGDKKYLDHLRKFEEPTKLLVEALEHPDQAPRGFDMKLNGTSLLLDGLAVAVRNGSTDVRLPDLMRRYFDRATQNVDAAGFGQEIGQKDGQNSSWVLRVIAGAPLLDRDNKSEQRQHLVCRVLGAHDHIDRMRIKTGADPIDGIDALGIASWLLAYWRLIPIALS